MDAFISALGTLGYIQCEFGDSEAGYKQRYLRFVKITSLDLAMPRNRCRIENEQVNWEGWRTLYIQIRKMLNTHLTVK
ncbi:MAG: hypothetical protein OXE41_03910 [Gammaproteobacteria bacterium]|nr:hypothetical protein [Gammaproteobacteria bacterium]